MFCNWFTYLLSDSESDSDTTLTALAFISIGIFRKKKKKRSTRRMWQADWLKSRPTEGAYHKLFPEIMSEDENLYRNIIRMTPPQFQVLLEKITPWIIKKATNFREPISPAERLLVTLRYLATGKKVFYRISFACATTNTSTVVLKLYVFFSLIAWTFLFFINDFGSILLTSFVVIFFIQLPTFP